MHGSTATEKIMIKQLIISHLFYPHLQVKTVLTWQSVGLPFRTKTELVLPSVQIYPDIFQIFVMLGLCVRMGNTPMSFFQFFLSRPKESGDLCRIGMNNGSAIY